MIEGISAITLATHDMGRAVRFYRLLGFEVLYGGEDAGFTSFRAGAGYLNLTAQPPSGAGRGGAGRSFTSRMSMPCTPVSLPPGCGPTPRRAMPNGASASSTSPTRTATN